MSKTKLLSTSKGKPVHGGKAHMLPYSGSGKQTGVGPNKGGSKGGSMSGKFDVGGGKGHMAGFTGSRPAKVK